MRHPIDLSFTLTGSVMARGLQVGSGAVAKGARFFLSLPHVAMIFGAILAIAILSVTLSRTIGFHSSVVSIAIGAVAAFAAMMLIQTMQVRHVADVIVAATGGRIAITMDETGLTEASELGRNHLNWHALDEVLDFRDGIVLRFGAMLIVIPDTALSDGVDRAELKASISSLSGGEATR